MIKVKVKYLNNNIEIEFTIGESNVKYVTAFTRDRYRLRS